MHLSISNDIISTKIYDKRDDFDFEIVNFPFLDGDVPRSTSYGVNISQRIRFARASSYVGDFNTRNKLLTQKLLKQGYRYHKLRKSFSKFHRRYYDLISKFQSGLIASFVDLLCFILSCVCCVFVPACFCVLCGRLLGRGGGGGWLLGSRLWCLLWVCHFPVGVLGRV